MQIQLIEQRLRRALAPATVLTVDESHLHRGHAGTRPYGQSHYRVRVVTTAFVGKNRVERQRMAFAAIGKEVGEEIHALSFSLLAPDEV